MSVESVLREKLTAALAPASLTIENQSHLHQGHAGHDGGGESHFAVTVVASAFEGLSRVERHRKVNTILADELAGKVHALALVTRTPAEAAR